MKFTTILSWVLLLSATTGCTDGVLFQNSSPSFTDASESKNSPSAKALTTSRRVYDKAWKTVDDYQYVPGSSSVGYSITSDSTGRLFASGYGYYLSSSDRHWLVRTSEDGGATWTNAMDFQDLNYGQRAEGYSILSMLDGTLLTAGVLSNNALFTWAIRKLSPGQAWQTTDTYQLEGGFNSFAIQSTGIALSPMGAVFTIGYAATSSGKHHWITRRSTDAGSTWATVDDFIPVSTTWGASPASIAFTSDGSIYVAGSADDANGTGWSVIRRSTDNGLSWTTLFQNQYYPGYTSYITAIGIDPKDKIYIANSGVDASLKMHWIVQKSTDAGMTWTTIDDYTSNAFTPRLYQTKLIADSDGNLFVAGNAMDSNSALSYFIRHSSDGGLTWKDSDLFQYSAGKSSTLKSIAQDKEGNVWVTGYALDPLGNDHWITRRLSCHQQ